MLRLEYFKIIAANDLVHWVGRPFGAMVLAMKEKGALVWHEDGLQLPVPSQCQEMIENADNHWLSGKLWYLQHNRMAWQWAETLVEIRETLADIRGTTK